ncbi:hypothetical protein FS842_005638 [Serendipita sp. 407]|nr:hypothetical protein FS842_005638 [Serendipita sp. 407]
MMAQDLLYLVAKQPNISFVLLEPSIYPHVAKIATSNFQGRSSGKLLRRLQRLVAESSPEILSLRKTLYPILAKGFIEEAGRPLLRELCQKLFRLVQRGSPHERLACLGLLETIAQTVTTIPEAFQISWVLAEPDFYETIEKMWALGPRSPVSVDQLYALVKQSLLNRLVSARTLVQSQTKGEETPQTTLPSNHTRIPSTTTDSNSTLSSRQTSFMVATFRDLLSICNSPDVYDDDAVNTAITILIEASEAHETVSLLLLEPTLLSLYEVLADIHLTPNATPSTRHARLLYDRIKLLNTRKGFREAKNLIGRLKHTRNWSGLDSENIRPLCETLVTYATDPNLSKFHDSAIESLIDLTSSPPPCATVLLEPQFAKRIGGIARSPLRDRPLPNSQAVVTSEPDQQFNVSELARRMSVLALQEELRGNIPRLLALSDHPSPFRLQKVDKEEYQELIDKLLFLYRQKQQDSATFRIIIKSFLIIATGNDIGLDFLINSGSDVIRYLREASSSSLLPNIRTISGSEVVFDMLHDLVRHLEIDADQLLQRSPPLRSRHSIDRSRFNDTFENENDLDRAQALCWRLINICR